MNLPSFIGLGSIEVPRARLVFALSFNVARTAGGLTRLFRGPEYRQQNLLFKARYR
jgi:hypothetical protein